MILKTTGLKQLAKNIILPLAALLLTTATVYGQNERVKFSNTRLTAREALNEIQAQTSYIPAFNSRLFDAGRAVSLSATDLSLDAALRQILGSGFSYVLSGNILSITKDAVEPVKEVVMPRERKPLTSDVYQRNSFDDLSAAPRRRPVMTNVIEAPIVEQPAAAPQMREQTSRYRFVEQYAVNQASLPRFAIKTNLLYGAAAFTPNLAFEFGLGRRTSLELMGSHNPWNLSGSLDGNKKLVHTALRAEFRYCLCERFNGHFFGADVIFSRYNIGTHEVPMLFKKEYRYDGVAYGGGVTYGYHLMVGKRWGIEFSVGAGVLWLDYDRYECAACNRNGIPEKKVYFGPTNASINLVFLLK